MKRLSLALVTALVFGVATQARALTITTLDGGGLDALIGAALTAPLSDTFDFVPSNAPPGDGKIVSQVYTGTGAAAGLNVFIYQITVESTASVAKINSFSVDFPPNPASSPATGPIEAFNVDQSVTASTELPAAFALGVEGAGTFDWFGGAITVSGTTPWLVPGQVSFVFGTFAPAGIGYGIRISDVTDTGATLKSASVYSAAPEPGSLLLLGAGLAGIGLTGRRRRRS